MLRSWKRVALLLSVLAGGAVLVVILVSTLQQAALAKALRLELVQLELPPGEDMLGARATVKLSYDANRAGAILARFAPEELDASASCNPWAISRTNIGEFEQVMYFAATFFSVRSGDAASFELCWIPLTHNIGTGPKAAQPPEIVIPMTIRPLPSQRLRERLLSVTRANDKWVPQFVVDYLEVQNGGEPIKLTSNPVKVEGAKR